MKKICIDEACSTQSTCFTWGYMSTNVLLFKVILNKVWADHFPSLLVVLNFNLWSDNNNNPEQCNVPDGLRSNDLSNRKQTLYQLCIVEGGYESSPVAIIYVVDEVYPYPLHSPTPRVIIQLWRFLNYQHPTVNRRKRQIDTHNTAIINITPQKDNKKGMFSFPYIYVFICKI
jgi:hypothetical protein